MPGKDNDKKAIIINLENKKEVECTFRPKEITYSKQNTWSAPPKKGKDIPKPEFGGGGAMQLQMELFFDTTENGLDKATDVRQVTKDLWKMMLIDSKLKDPQNKKGRPPRVQFHWGSMLSFKAYIQSINQRFTLFKPDGTPVRATMSVTFQQFEEPAYVPQNPTSLGSGGERTLMVREGDTMDMIAYEEYGDVNLWRLIARANGLEDPMRLRPGQILLIPPLV